MLHPALWRRPPRRSGTVFSNTGPVKANVFCVSEEIAFLSPWKPGKVDFQRINRIVLCVRAGCPHPAAKGGRKNSGRKASRLTVQGPRRIGSPRKAGRLGVWGKKRGPFGGLVRRANKRKDVYVTSGECPTACCRRKQKGNKAHRQNSLGEESRLGKP